MIILSAFVAGCAALYVLAPLLGWQSAPAFPDEATLGRSSREELLRERREILAAIKDLEMEYEVGKLTREDYTRTREQMAQQALEIYRKMDGNGQT